MVSAGWLTASLAAAFSVAQAVTSVDPIVIKVSIAGRTRPLGAGD